MRVDGLFVCEVGVGRPIIVLHGGPDFDHTYLRPELDRLADQARLIYYDQRGRGRSAGGVAPEDVTIESEVADVDTVRRALGLETVALLGHSWGGVVAMEYATRHPDRVSHLVLMNTAPASHDDYVLWREWLASNRPAGDAEQIRSIAATDPYRRGELVAEAAYYRAHFSIAIADPEQLERLVARLRVHFTPQAVLLARDIERRLYEETWLRPEYDLVSRLRGLDAPTLVLHGDRDFIPSDVARHIAATMPQARLVVLPDCGHFAYLERPEEVCEQLAAFLAVT